MPIQDVNHSPRERPTLPDIFRWQSADRDILEVKCRIQQGMASNLEKKCILLDKDMYYLSQQDDKPIVRRYIQSYLRKSALGQQHDDDGHMGTVKMFQAIKPKHSWSYLFRDDAEFVRKCIPCQTRNLRELQLRMHDYDMPSFPKQISLKRSLTYEQVKYSLDSPSHELIADNFTENVMKVMKETLVGLNVHHVTVSFTTHKSTVRQNGFIGRRMIFY